MEEHNISETRVTASPLRPTRAHEVEDLGDNWSFVAASPAMRQVRQQVSQVAKIDVPVLLLGESGTGKEVIARLIHRESLRAQHTFMKVNCAAVPETLLESELFGYERGAFTGAASAKPGKFETCHRGTLFLDEIAEMPFGPQAKLLHALQDGEFSRLGSTTTAKVDVRVLAATNVDVAQAIQTQRFRADLYYRLNAFTIDLPPLRNRPEDIPELLEHFLETWSQRLGRPRVPISRKMLDTCLRYPWPGNVRELENVAKRFVVLGDEDQVLAPLGSKPSACPPRFQTTQRIAPGDYTDLKSLSRNLKREAEKEAILRALEQSHGSRKLAAKALRISLRALHYKIHDYGIDQPEAPPNVSAA